VISVQELACPQAKTRLYRAKALNVGAFLRTAAADEGDDADDDNLAKSQEHFEQSDDLFKGQSI
jgi:hypothetical protein